MICFRDDSLWYTYYTFKQVVLEFEPTRRPSVLRATFLVMSLQLWAEERLCRCLCRSWFVLKTNLIAGSVLKSCQLKQAILQQAVVYGVNH